ncbi:MAG: fused MFS/spermidine synthase, partial [Micavibrio aeruginosavorus]|nr:fused MFS/spermidine synthase [Micavibrio aeruginosavorus]
DILTIGAGGFTVGLNDRKNHYTFVDVDPKLKETTENLFLQDTLSDNKAFVPEEARAFLNRNDRKFDMIFLDTYSSSQGLPESLLTKEFFEQIRDTMKPDGVLVINAVQSHTFADVFSVRFDNTLRAVFQQVTREIASPVPYSFWDRSQVSQNVMYTAFNRPKGDVEIYTDDLNPSFRDRGKPVRK